MSRDGYNRDQFSGTRQSTPYTNQNMALLSPTGSAPYMTGGVPSMQYRDSSGGTYQPTLGQMAEQIQERARAEAALAARMGGSGGSELGVQGSDEYYDYGGGGVDNYDDDGADNDGDGEDESGQLATGNESTGRWTRAEHELFLQALKKYGKEWKKVASMVKTRTVVQTRTHAQKYFQKLTKTAGGAMGGIASAGSNFPSGRGATPASANANGADKSGGSGLFYHKPNKRGGGAPIGMSPPAAMGADLGNSMAVMQMAQMHPSMLLNSNIGLIPTNMVPSYLPTTQGYGEIDNQDYYESMEVAALMGELNKVPTAVQTPLQLSMGLPNISTGGIDPPDFPEPSPAACGKRKHAELQAAQMLAASSSSKAPRPGGALSANAGYGSVSDYADALISASNGHGSGVKGAGGPQLVRDLSSGSVPGGAGTGANVRRPRVNLTLSIVDPSENGATNDPGTPWEAAIQHLEQETANAPLTSRLMRSNSFSNYTMPAVPVNTPSEQRSFINKVRALVRDADLAGLASLLGAAEYSAQVTVKTEDDAADGGHDPAVSAQRTSGDQDDEGGGKRAAVSNLLSMFTPDGSDGVENGADTESGSNGDNEALTLTSMNTQINSGVPAGSPRKYSASQVARSLNRVERNSRSVLMEVASTADPAINQTLLYSMCMLLIEHGAVAGLPDSRGSTALHYAAAQGHERVGRLLLTKGCPLNLQNVDGDTATHIAARNGHVAFIEMLADLGANFHIRNGASMCALDLLGSKSSDDAQRAHLRKLMLTAEPRLRTLVLYHEEFQEHTARRPSDWEGPDRLDAIMTRLRDKTEFPEHEVEISNRFEKADVELLGRVHSPEYIGFVNMLSKQVQTEANDKEGGKDAQAVLPFTPQVQRFVRRQHSEELKSGEACDTSFSVGTLSAARRAAGAVAFAVDRVMLGRNRNAFCAVRPPGHHAGYRGLLDGANSCGFCIFNNVAAGALHALVAHQCERVAIIDLDVHHGNGTEDIVRRYAHPSRLFFFSLHLYDKDDAAAQAAAAAAPKTTTDRPIDAVTAGGDGGTPTGRSYEFYPGTGVRDDHVHNIINVPMTPLWAVDDSHRANKSTPTHPHGQFVGREGYRQAISLRLIPTLRAFNPTLILLSAGFDAAAGDVGNSRQFPGEASARMGIDLQPEDFAWATTEIMKIADICCGGRLVSVLEGGYGEYAPVQPAKHAVHHVPTTRGASRHQVASAPSTAEKPTVSQPDTPKAQSTMNRALLGKVAAAHVRRLMDPYGATHDPAAPVATAASK